MIFDPLNTLSPQQQALYWRLRNVERAALMVLLFCTILSLLVKHPTTATIVAVSP
ncbi:MAG: hypothetical protein QMD46_12725 [Methanomicrobiales archaeon]|nr:hypothetical protein [Methanomicrobiales archaeon]